MVTVSCGETQSSTGCLLGVFAFNMSDFLFTVTNGLYYKAGNKKMHIEYRYFFER